MQTYKTIKFKTPLAVDEYLNTLTRGQQGFKIEGYAAFSHGIVITVLLFTPIRTPHNDK